jgi:ADP-heptose:LPS heptosyltransferase
MMVENPGEDFDAGPDALVDTAALMQSLDLIISCDTSVAHLAGALGRPVWTALKRHPEWRWGANGETMPWYPTMTLFRQAQMGQWEPVFAAMRDRLAILLESA